MADLGLTIPAAIVARELEARLIETVSVVTYQEKSREIINEMRASATRNSAEIRDAVEDGKRRLAQLAAEGNALMLETKQA